MNLITFFKKDPLLAFGFKDCDKKFTLSDFGGKYIKQNSILINERYDISN